jgi:hypothetical protein
VTTPVKEIKTFLKIFQQVKTRGFFCSFKKALSDLNSCCLAAAGLPDEENRFLEGPGLAH